MLLGNLSYPPDYNYLFLIVESYIVKLDVSRYGSLMESQGKSPNATIEQVVQRIFSTHRITRADQRLFMATLLSKDTLSPEEQEHIDKVFDALRRGLLRVVD